MSFNHIKILQLFELWPETIIKNTFMTKVFNNLKFTLKLIKHFKTFSLHIFFWSKKNNTFPFVAFKISLFLRTENSSSIETLNIFCIWFNNFRHLHMFQMHHAINLTSSFIIPTMSAADKLLLSLLMMDYIKDVTN